MCCMYTVFFKSKIINVKVYPIALLNQVQVQVHTCVHARTQTHDLFYFRSNKRLHMPPEIFIRRVTALYIER